MQSLWKRGNGGNDREVTRLSHTHTHTQHVLLHAESKQSDGVLCFCLLSHGLRGSSSELLIRLLRHTTGCLQVLTKPLGHGLLTRHLLLARRSGRVGSSELVL